MSLFRSYCKLTLLLCFQCEVISAYNVPIYTDEIISEKDLLRGFKQNVDESEDRFRRKVFQGEVVQTPANRTIMFSSERSTSNSFESSIDVSGKVSLSVFIAEVTGELQYIDKTFSTNEKVTWEYGFRRTKYAKRVLVDSLTPANDIESLDAGALADNFGTKFVDSIIYGAELQIFHTVSRSKKVSEDGLEGQVELKIGLCPFCIVFPIKFGSITSTESSTYEVETKVKVRGLDLVRSVTQDPTDVIEKFFDRLEEFDAQVDPENINALNHYGPIGYTLQSISDIHIGSIDSDHSTLFDTSMDKLRQILSSTVALKKLLLETRDAQKGRYLAPADRENIFVPYQLELDKMVTKVEGKLQECLAYQRLSFEQIVGINGTEKAHLPEEGTFNQEGNFEIIQGLLGKGWINNPIVGSTTFDDMSYYGFVLYDDNGEAKPWMQGSLVRNGSGESYEVVAEALTPAELEKKGRAAENLEDLSLPSPTPFVTYQQPLYLQSNNRWLDEASGSVYNAGSKQGKWSIQSVYRINNTLDYTAEAQDQLSDTGYEADQPPSDPKYGDCVKYGDIVFLRRSLNKDVASPANEWLVRNMTLVRNTTLHGDPIVLGRTEGLTKDNAFAEGARWNVRGTPGDFVLPGNHPNCPTGFEIRSFDQCQAVGELLGGRREPLQDGIQMGGKPCGCFWTRDRRIEFNEESTNCVASSDFFPICHTPDDNDTDREEGRCINKSRPIYFQSNDPEFMWLKSNSNKVQLDMDLSPLQSYQWMIHLG